MKLSTIVSFLTIALVEAYIPSSVKKTTSVKPVGDAGLQKAAAGAFAALTIASSSVVLNNPAVVPPAQAISTVATVTPSISATSSYTSSSQLVSVKVIREGVYGEYEYDMPDQKYDDARSTFKSAKETKSNKGKYTALLAILIVGSFIIPMAQYYWYVKDDDSTDKFFGTQVPDPEPPKKKGWFN